MILFPLSLESQGEMDDCEWKDTVQLYKEEVSRESVCLYVCVCMCVFSHEIPSLFCRKCCCATTFSRECATYGWTGKELSVASGT